MTRWNLLIAALCAVSVTLGAEEASAEVPTDTEASAEGVADEATPVVAGDGDDVAGDGDGMAEGEGEGDGDEGPLTPEQMAWWEETLQQADIDAQGLRAEAESLYLQARAYYQRADFVLARDAIEAAIEAWPEHEGARQLQDDILGVLGERDNRLQMAAVWMAQLKDVAVQEQAVQMQRLLDEGDRLLNAGDYVGASLAFDRVSIGIRSFPYQFDWGDLPEAVNARKLRAQALARQADLADREVSRELADEVAARQAEWEEQALQMKVDEILTRAIESFRRHHFSRAAEDAFTAYQMDRRREDARTLYLEARSRAHDQFDDHYREERLERLARVNENIHRALVPQTELLVYPEDWFRRSLRSTEELVDEVDEPWRRELLNQLNQEVTFQFDETPLSEVAAYLRRVTGVNIVVEPDALIDDQPLIISGTMSLGQVLQWVSDMTDLRYSLQNEAIYFSSEDVQGDVSVRLYNVSDLISPVEDFPGPELAFSAIGGGGGGGFDIFGDVGGGGGGGEEFTIDDIQDFIMNSVSPDSWDRDGVAIDSRTTGTLFVSQTPEIHRQIDDLLGNLRNQRALQVNVQIRLLDMTKSFREEIGIEWNDFVGDLLNGPDSEGFLDGGSEWSLGASTQNELPGNQSQTGFSNNFGAGLRAEYMYNIGGILNQPQLNVVLTAVEAEADGQILNAPEITCFNGQRANAQFIRQFAYISDYDVAGGGNYDPVIEVLNYGDIIDVRPLVSADRKYVTLEVRPTSVLLQDVFVELITTVAVVNNVAGVVSYPLELPNLEVRTMRSTVQLPDKGSLMMGGFVRGLRQRTHAGVPFLSHIPFFGRLFSQNGIYDENRHLMFLVTVEIIDLAEREAQQ